MTHTKYTLARDGKEIFTGTENECYIKLQKYQSMSFGWAMKHEGYTIEESKASGCEDCGSDADLMIAFTDHKVCGKCTRKKHKSLTK